MGQLYPFQCDDIAFHLNSHYSLNCSEMGLGKTRIALTTAGIAGGRVAVFGPAFLKGAWLEETARISGPQITYFPYSTLHRVASHMLEGYSFWIADEVHMLKNPYAQRTQSFYALLKSLLPQYFLGLTGTPIKNRVPDFWTLLAFCSANPLDTNGLKLGPPFNGYKSFSSYFCHVEKFRVARRTVEKYVGIKEEKLPELKLLLKGKYVRHLVADVLKDLPELVRKPVYIPLEETLDLGDTFEAYMSGSKADIGAKVASAILKASSTAEYCRMLLEGGSGPLVIFTDHVEPARIIASALKGSLLVTGEVASAARSDMVAKFQFGNVPAIVATIGSLSVGVTLTAARHVVMNDLSWVPADNAQAEKRIHRIGQKNACVAHYIESSATDRYIRKTLESKQGTINLAMGETKTWNRPT